MQTLFLHGLGQSPSSWDKTISCLSESINAHCPNLAVFLTDTESRYENLYRAFEKYCEGFCEPLNLCGLSLGAVLAINYAIDNPNRVNSLILISPQYEMPKALLKFQNIIFNFMPESTFEEIGFSKADFIELTNSMAELNFKNDLEKVSCPALILCGEKDNANKKAARSLAKIHKDAEFCLVGKSGHEVNVDAPERLAELISGFLFEAR